jgi:D-hexose-6-phosphate mutarotase
MNNFEEKIIRVSTWLKNLPLNEYIKVTTNAKNLTQHELNYSDDRIDQIMTRFSKSEMIAEDDQFRQSFYNYLDEIRKNYHQNN